LEDPDKNNLGNIGNINGIIKAKQDKAGNFHCRENELLRYNRFHVQYFR